jgi:hypothetical protein
MKRIALYKYLLGGLMMAVTAACSGSEDDNTLPSPIEDMPKTVRLTITQTADDNGSANARLLDGTRATLNVNNQNDKVLDASWTANDGLTYYNLNQQFINDHLTYVFGQLTATETATKSSFTGDVTCYEGNKLAVIYPATSFTAGTEIQPYSITLSGQDGTLGTLATTFHHVYGVATVGPVVGTTATATMPKMKSLLTVCKFSFIDESNSSPISVKTLSIGFTNGVVGQADAGKYPQSATVTPYEDQTQVHATAVTGSSTPLTIKLSQASNEVYEVYVALLPTPTDATQPISFTFTVNDGTNTYSGTARAYLHEGKYVVATGLKLTKKN